MNKRASGPPRRPRNPIAREVRDPKYRPRIVPDKRWSQRIKEEDKTGHHPDGQDEEGPGNEGGA